MRAAAPPGSLTCRQVQLGVRAVGVATQEASERREAHSSQEARSVVAEVCASVARAAVRDYGNDARAKRMLGVGPLTVLDDAELSHWQHLLRVQVEACALDTLSRLTAEVEVLARKSQGKPAQRSAEVAVTVARDIAPLEDSASVRGRLQRAVDAVRASDADAARVLLGTVVVEERAALVAAPGVDAGKASFYGTLLTLAHFLERADGADEACVALAQDVLLSALNSSDGGSWKSCFLDTDQLELASGACSAATQLLGEEHVLVKALERLSASRAVPPPVEEEWPDESLVRAARIADAQADQPVPERVWAMRNAAATLAMTGARPQAVALLTRAVQLKVEWLGREDPRVLGELCDLHAYTDAVDAAADVAGARLACSSARCVAHSLIRLVCSPHPARLRRRGRAAGRVWRRAGCHRTASWRRIRVRLCPWRGGATACARSEPGRGEQRPTLSRRRPLAGRGAGHGAGSAPQAEMTFRTNTHDQCSSAHFSTVVGFGRRRSLLQRGALPGARYYVVEHSPLQHISLLRTLCPTPTQVQIFFASFSASTVQPPSARCSSAAHSMPRTGMGRAAVTATLTTLSRRVRAALHAAVPRRRCPSPARAPWPVERVGHCTPVRRLCCPHALPLSAERLEDISESEESESLSEPDSEPAKGPPWKCAICPKARRQALSLRLSAAHVAAPPQVLILSELSLATHLQSKARMADGPH